MNCQLYIISPQNAYSESSSRLNYLSTEALKSRILNTCHLLGMWASDFSSHLWLILPFFEPCLCKSKIFEF